MQANRKERDFYVQAFDEAKDALEFSRRCIREGHRPVVVLPYDRGRSNPWLQNSDIEILLTNPGEGYESAEMIRDILSQQEGWKKPNPFKEYDVQDDIIGFYELKITFGHDFVATYRPITRFREIQKWVASFNLIGETRLNECCADFLYRRLRADGFSIGKSFDVIVCAEAKAMQVTQILSGMFGESRHVVLRKGVKNYMPQHPTQPITEELESITTRGKQQLVLDPNDVALIANRRVLFVDDVVATGGTIKAAVRLVEKVSGSVVRIETVLLKGRHPGLKGFNYLKKALL